MRPDSPEEFVESLEPDERVTVLALRRIIHGLIPGIVESALWGGLSYHRPAIGGRVKGAVCQIVAREGRIRLDFIHGVHLEDPRHVLQGDRVSKRYVPITGPEDAARPEIAALIAQAAAGYRVAGHSRTDS